MVTFSKFYSGCFTASPIDVVAFKCHKICPTGNRWNRALFTPQKNNKISAPFQTVATARIAPKVCQGQPWTFGTWCFKFHSAQLYPNAWRPFFWLIEYF